MGGHMRDGCVGIAKHEDADEISKLRISSYQEAKEFRLLLPQALVWDPEDRRLVVITARDRLGSILSTTQGMLLSSRTDAERTIGVSVSLDATHFPALLIGRGATVRSHGRSGLHSVLRWHFLRAASEANINAVLGLVYESAPRVKLMRELGYQMHVPERVWDPEVEVVRPALLAVLPRLAFSSALARLTEIVGSTIESYPWEGPAIRLEALLSNVPQSA